MGGGKRRQTDINRAKGWVFLGLLRRWAKRGGVRLAEREAAEPASGKIRQRSTIP